MTLKNIVAGVLCICGAISICAPATGQSLDANNPGPLKAGINSATADSTVGTQYWYYTAEPGEHTVKVTFQSMGVLGNPMRNTLAVTLSSPLGAEKKLAVSEKESATVSFTGKMVKPTRMVVRIDPMSPTGLIRQGGDCQVQVTGAVRFDGGGSGGASAPSNAFGSASASVSSSQQDPVVRAYMCMQNDHGITKFLADGTITAADGNTGIWKLEDSESQAYTVKLGNDKLSLIFQPGRGLVSAESKDILIFKQLH